MRIPARERSAPLGSSSGGLGSRGRRVQAEPAAQGSLGRVALRRRPAESVSQWGTLLSGDHDRRGLLGPEEG